MLWHRLVFSLTTTAENPHLLLYSLPCRFIGLVDFVLGSFSVSKVIKSNAMRWTVHVAHVGKKRNACTVFVGKPEGKSPL
jgi:hypothetical protein